MRNLINGINEFLNYLRLEKNLAPRTVSAYSHDLFKFVSFLVSKYGKEPLLNQITTQDIRDFLSYLQTKRNCKSCAVYRKLSCLRSFFSFLCKQSYITSDPTEAVSSPKLPKKLPIYLTEEELQRLLSAPNREENIGIRDFAILVLLSYTGMRLSELTGLNIDSINLSEGYVRILGKGNKERIVPLIESVTKAVRDYLNIRPITEDVALFLNRQKKRLSTRSVENIVYKYGKIAGIPKEKLSPHKLRHTFATMLHNKDVDILDIQALLGHASIATTQIYTHTNPKRLRKVVERLPSP